MFCAAYASYLATNCTLGDWAYFFRILSYALVFGLVLGGVANLLDRFNSR